MSENNIPEKVQNWFEFGEGTLSFVEVKTFPNEEIAGESIMTGVVGNEMDEDVVRLLQKHSGKDFFIACEYLDRENTLGSMSIPFEDRDSAEKFEELVREKGGSLRLSASKMDGWFNYESE
jgi:hypothetical protein